MFNQWDSLTVSVACITSLPLERLIEQLSVNLQNRRYFCVTEEAPRFFRRVCLTLNTRFARALARLINTVKITPDLQATFTWHLLA